MVKTYKCPACGEFEHECSITDAELDTCTYCGEKVKRVYKAPHYSFKCSGFAGRGFD